MNWAAEVTSTGISVQTVTGLVSLVLGIGAVAVGISKAVRGLRRFARLLDGFLGDGTTKHPSVPDRLSAMETNQEEFKETQDELAAKVEALTVTVDHHVDGDAQKWLADGQAWGNRLDADVASVGSRVSALEQRTSG